MCSRLQALEAPPLLAGPEVQWKRMLQGGTIQSKILRWTRGSATSDYKVRCLMGCNAVQSGKSSPAFLEFTGELVAHCKTALPLFYASVSFRIGSRDSSLSTVSQPRNQGSIPHRLWGTSSLYPVRTRGGDFFHEVKSPERETNDASPSSARMELHLYSSIRLHGVVRNYAQGQCYFYLYRRKTYKTFAYSPLIQKSKLDFLVVHPVT